MLDIIKVSHMMILQVLTMIMSTPSLRAAENLFSELANISHLFVAPSETPDLTQLTLNQYIGNNRVTVVLWFSLDHGIALDKYANQGFYLNSQTSVYDSYANSDDSNTTIDDQLQKLPQQRTSRSSISFEA
jgi:hypothetical protein